MHDFLFIECLQAKTYIGVYAWEQETKQTVELDLQLSVKIDHLTDEATAESYVDYGEVCSKVTDYIEGKRFRLIETLAQEVVSLIFTHFQVEEVTLSTHKVGIIANVKKVGLSIKRKRES